MLPSQTYVKPPLLDSVKLGAALGIGAAWAIFGLILAAGAQMGLPPGTFYEMVGVSLGQSAEWPAIYLGFALHMMTGGIIGIVYMVISDGARQFRSYSTIKWFGTGLATGIVVWAVLFVPLHYFLVQPTLQNMLLTSPLAGSAAHSSAERLNQMSDSILYGALAMHLVFGSILGFLARIVTSSRDVAEKESGGVRQYDAAA
jgi:hypothetical protein